MKIKSTKIKGVKLIYPKVIKDKRGYFVEMYNLKKLKKFFSGNFVQENISLSIQKNTFRGLHFQKNKFSQDKLLSVTKGEIVDYIFDLRFNLKQKKMHIYYIYIYTYMFYNNIIYIYILTNGYFINFNFKCIFVVFLSCFFLIKSEFFI